MSEAQQPEVIQKKQLVVANSNGARNASNPPTAVHVEEMKAGSVNIVDSAKAYWHTAITVVAGILILLQQITPVFNFLPAGAQKYFAVAVAFVAAVLNFLKSNEVWVDDL
jgi:hypothetical protein